MKRRILSGILVAAMATTMFATTAFAATSSKEVEVSYNNTDQITDPSEDNDPKWAVEIPSAIVFNDTTKEVDTTVTLVGINGGDLTDVENVTVTVESDNEYVLGLDGNKATDPVAYSLLYNGTKMSSTSKTVGVLSESTTEAPGIARLLGTATQTGNHTDTLRYIVDDGKN